MKNHALLVLFTFFSFSNIHPQVPAGTARGVLPAGTPIAAPTAEMQQLEAELAAFQKEIEALSPEEQESFFKSMEEAVQKIDELSKTEEGKALLERLDKGDISDEELDKLINQIVGEEEPVVLPEEILEPTKPIEVPKPILTSKQEQAIDTINAIIAHTSAFLVKAATLPELPGKIKKWEKKKLIEWKPELTWNSLKTDIEQFVSQLGHVLDRDQRTKAYYHIDELLKDEPLLNSLKKIQQVVSQYEPLIEEISPLHTMRTSKASKDAFQKMINQYSEALYTLNIVDEIKKLLTKFEPAAKAAREAEEKALQKAELERKRKLAPGAPITVGAPEIPYTPGARMYEEDYEPRAPRVSRGYEPSYRDPFADLARPTDSKVPTSTARGKGAATPKGKEEKEAEKEEGKVKGKEEKEDLMTRLKKQAEKMDAKLFQEADAIVAKIAANLEQVATAVKETPLFATLENHLKDASEINFEFATEVVPGIARDLSVRRGALGNMEQLHRKLTSPAARKKYQTTLKKLLEKFKEPLEAIIVPLTKIEKAWPELQNAIPKSKLYAYFGKAEEITPAEDVQEDIEKELQIIEKTAPSLQAGLEQAVSLIEEKKQPVDEKLAEAQQKISTPVSLFELKKNIEALKEMVKNFDQPPKQAVKPDQSKSKAIIKK
jgi:hypothetical protein